MLEEFYQLTNKDLTSYFQQVKTFFSGSDYQKLINYYSGKVSSIDSTPFNNLQSLADQTKEIFTLYSNFSNSMSGSWFYDLLDIIENIDNRISTSQNLNRWCRSSLNLTGYSPIGEVQYTIGQNESLERISKDLLNSTSPEDDWFDIAKRNDLTEESYTSQGGNSIVLPSSPTSNFAFPLNSVMDVINGKSVYGKDLDRNFSIDVELGDIKVLDYDDTILQSSDILINLKKNDNPDFRDKGLQTTLVIGSNSASLNFPVIRRQLSDSFSTDDTFTSFNITSIQVTNNSLLVAYQVQTRLSEVLLLETTL